MTPLHIVALGTRFFSIWIMMNAIQSIRPALTASEQLSDSDFAIHIVRGLVMAALAFIVRLFPMAIAKRVLPRANDTHLISMPGRHVARLAAATIGIWFIVDSLHALVVLVFLFQDPTFEITRPHWMLVALAIVPFGIGLYLLMKRCAVADRILVAVITEPVPRAPAASHL